MAAGKNTLRLTQASIAEINEKITQLNDKKTQLLGDIEVKKKSLTSIEQSHQADNQQHHEKTEEINLRIQQEKAKADQLVIDIQKLTEKLDTEQQAEAALKSKIKEFENQLKDAVSKRDECLALVKRLEDTQAAQRQQHQSAISELENQITVLKQRLAVATEQLEKKSGDETKMKQDLENEQKAIREDKVKVQEVKEKIKNAEDEKKKATEPKHCLSVLMTKIIGQKVFTFKDWDDQLKDETKEEDKKRINDVMELFKPMWQMDPKLKVFVDG